MQRTRQLVSGLASLAFVASAAAGQDIRLGSIDAARFGGTSWTLNGSNLEEARAKLLDTENFGDPGGVVPRDVVITDTAGPITAELLATFDVFFIGYFDDEHAGAFTADELDAFFAWVEGGGAMLITCDDSGHDAVCARFGSPVTGFTTDNLADAAGPGFGHPALAGPFGPVRQVTIQDARGTFDDPLGGDVLMRTATGRDPIGGVAGLGTGRVMIVGDIDLFSDRTLTESTTGILSANDALLGNAVAWLAGASDSGLCTPTETTLCLDGAVAGDGRFAVTVAFETVQSGGISGDALATPLQGVGARQGGLFTFFDEANPEMVLKILDGCLVTGHFWVYASAGTNVGFTLEIQDLLAGSEPKVYTNPDLTQAPPIQDVLALPCGAP